MSLSTRLVAVCPLVLMAGSACAVSTFTETFATGDSDWLNGSSGTPTYVATGGASGFGDTGFISYTPAPFNSGAGGFGDPLRILFRGNNAADASGDAFVGNWLADGVQSFSVAVRHNHDTDLTLFLRLNAQFGAAASLANDALYTIAPNTWTTITVPIVDSNPPFLSYGAGNFNSVFSGINDVQVGLYLPGDTEFDGLTVDLDNVNITVPEPGVAGAGLAGLGMLLRRRRGVAAA